MWSSKFQNPKSKIQNHKVLSLLVLVFIVAAGAWAVRTQSSTPGAEQATLWEPFSAEPGRQGEANEYLSAGTYWHDRVTYPTGRFDNAWLQEAARKDKLVQERVPAGRVIYDRD